MQRAERNNPAMTNIKPETINGKLCSVIRKPFCAEWVREQLAMGVPVVADYGKKGFAKLTSYDDTRGAFCSGNNVFAPDYTDWRYTLTILPPLPRRPTAEDAGLLHLYAAHGIFANF